MKKTILATAIAAAVMAAPMTAAANVVIYGKIHASIDYVSQDDYAVYLPITNEFVDISGEDNWEITSRTSRIGFKGSEDLGNGLKAIWKAEIGYNLDGTNGGGWGAGRNSYIGLAGDWGTVLIGKHDTPLKISTGRLDLFADTMADYNSTLLFTDRRAGNVIAYISPNWNGFTFAAAGVASEDYSGDIGNGGWSIAGMYFNNGFYGSLAFEDVTKLGLVDVGSGFNADDQWDGFESDFVDSNTVWRAGLGYIMNAFTIGAVYENQQLDLRDGLVHLDTDWDKWMIVGAYDFGNNTVKAMFGQVSTDVTLGDRTDSLRGDDTFNAWSIGWDHKLSVRTKVYALYADSELGLHNHSVTSFIGGQGFSMGMVHTF